MCYENLLVKKIFLLSAGSFIFMPGSEFGNNICDETDKTNKIMSQNRS